MFSIRKGKIEITRGDSASINVTLENYEMQSGDTLTMTVRQKPGAPILMEVVTETNSIPLTPLDTKKLIPGVCCYDIQLNKVSGGVYTVVGMDTIPYSYNMVVYPEITE